MLVQCSPACRFVDRDMVMRYHWGLGIGHLYSRMGSSVTHKQASPLLTVQCTPQESQEDTMIPDLDTETHQRGSKSNFAEAEGGSNIIKSVPGQEILDELPEDDSKSCDENSNGGVDTDFEGQSWSDSEGSAVLDSAEDSDSDHMSGWAATIDADDDISYD